MLPSHQDTQQTHMTFHVVTHLRKNTVSEQTFMFYHDRLQNLVRLQHRAQAVTPSSAISKPVFQPFFRPLLSCSRAHQHHPLYPQTKISVTVCALLHFSDHCGQLFVVAPFVLDLCLFFSVTFGRLRLLSVSQTVASVSLSPLVTPISPRLCSTMSTNMFHFSNSVL